MLICWSCCDANNHIVTRKKTIYFGSYLEIIFFTHMLKCDAFVLSFLNGGLCTCEISIHFEIKLFGGF
jgi:hypothetical protein